MPPRGWILASSTALLALAVPVAIVARLANTPKNAVRQSAPVLYFPAHYHDFGEVRQQQQLSHCFLVTNRGSVTITLKVKRIGCGCTSVSCPTEVLPGATAEIRMDVETRSYEGSVPVLVVIETSDPVLPIAEFRLSFYGALALNLDPPAIRIDEAKRGEEIVCEFGVITRIPNGEAPPAPEITASSPILRHHQVGARFAGRSIYGVPRFEHRFEMRVDSALVPIEKSEFRGTLMIRAQNPTSSVATELPVAIRFRHHSELAGQTAVTLTNATNKGAHISVWSRNRKPFRITRIESSLVDINAEIPNRSAEKHNVVISCRTKDGLAQLKSGQLRIQTAEYPDEPYVVDVILVP